VCKLDEMLPEYYQLNGWDAEGVPTRETLERLKLG
jgi:aldehyde:ferredoxin oxidoreductase